MKKKLLAVVLSLVMLVALLVPMMAISADTKPTATIYLGDPVAEGSFIKIPVYISGNTGEMCAIEYKVYSIDKLQPLDVVETGTIVDTFTNKLGALKTITFGAQGTAKYNPDDFDGYTGYKVLNDSSELDKGIKTEAGLIAEVYFEAPTVPKTYTFRVKGVSAAAFLEGAQSKTDVEDYIITDGADVTYTVECTSHVAGEAVVTKEPTCDEKGEKTVSCTACGKVMDTVEVAPLGHNMESDQYAGEAPTCTEEGKVVDKCTRCSKIEETPIPALGHDWDNGVAAEDVKCGETADTTFTCKREDCGETKVEKGAVVNHDMVADEANSKPATCTEDGVEAEKCAREGCDHTETTVLPKLGHEIVADPENSKAADCDEDGVEAKKCTRCDYTETKTLPKLGHEMVADEVNSKAPTCYAEGIEAKKCTRCDYTETKAIEKTEHDFNGKVVVITAPTADAEGKYTVACSNEGCTEVSEEKTADKLTTEVENKEAGVSFKSEEAVLPEDLTYELNDPAYDEATKKYSAVLTFASELVNNNLSGAVEVTMDVEGATNFAITTVDAEGNVVPVEFDLKDGVLTFNANLEGKYNLTFEEVKTSPDTGDAANTVVFAVVALMAVAGLVVVGKKRFAL